MCSIPRRNFHARVTTTWLVNSEGTIVRKSASEYQEAFGVGTQAADGMRLDRSYGSTGSSLKDLDAADVFEKHAVGLIASLTDLRKAPLVAEEEYHGPVLLSADAGADTLRALLASGVTATRPKLGTRRAPTARSHRVHARVLPEFLDVVDDPGLKTYDGKGLLGAMRLTTRACRRRP
jgi:TldD protein